MYGEKDRAAGRSMAIRFSEDARNVYGHPFISRHPESGRETLLGCLGYIVGVADMAEAEAFELIIELHHWQTREEFQYTHKWQEHMFVIWDNRSVLHKANGGYDGYDRVLHRITVAGDPQKFLPLSAA
jgi:taurine dioxygenase